MTGMNVISVAIVGAVRISNEYDSAYHCNRLIKSILAVCIVSHNYEDSAADLSTGMRCIDVRRSAAHSKLSLRARIAIARTVTRMISGWYIP